MGKKEDSANSTDGSGDLKRKLFLMKPFGNQWGKDSAVIFMHFYHYKDRKAENKKKTKKVIYPVYGETKNTF